MNFFKKNLTRRPCEILYLKLNYLPLLDELKLLLELLLLEPEEFPEFEERELLLLLTDEDELLFDELLFDELPLLLYELPEEFPLLRYELLLVFGLEYELFLLFELLLLR